MNRRLRSGGLASTLILAGTCAFAQTPAAAGRVEVSVGILRLGTVSFGSRDAQETTGTAGATFRLFSTTSELTGISGAAARVGLTIVRRLDAELSGSYAKPDLRTHITSDVESSNAPLVISAPVQQFTIGGGALWYLPVPRLGRKTTIFLRGGIDLERHVEDGGLRVVNGRSFEAGGGAKYLVGSRSHGWWKGIGARVDALALVHATAVTLDKRTHLSPAVGASIYLRF
jgi:hypothetical protein